MKGVFLWVVAVFVVLPGRAELSEEPGLGELLRFGAEHSFELRAAFEEWQGIRERIAQVRALPDPEISYGYFVERMDTRQSLSVSQMFPWPGKRGLRGSAAERAAEAAGAEVDRVRLELFEGIRSAYAEGLFLARARERVLENRELLARVERAAARQYEAGRGSYADTVRLGIELARMEEEIVSLEEAAGPVLRGLEALVGAERGRIARLGEGAEESAGREIPERVLLEERLLAGNPELRVAEAEVRRLEEEKRLARKAGLPDLMVGVEWMDSVGMEDETMAMVGISLPVWREKIRAGVREAERMGRGARLRREGLERELLAELEGAWVSVREAGRKIELYDEELIPRAREAVAGIQGSYLSGETGFADLIGVQRTLLDLQLERERLVADLARGWARVERMTNGEGG